MSNRSQSENKVDKHRSRKRLLLVEDDSRARLEFLNHLSKAGLEVIVAANGTLALKKLSEVSADAVVIDLTVRGMSGVDLIKEIRAKKGFAETPILVCTNDERAEMCRRAEKAGATRIFDKSATRMEKIVGDIVMHLFPPAQANKPKAAKPSLKKAGVQDIPTIFPENTFADVMQFSIGSNLPSPPPPASTPPALESKFDWAVVPLQRPETPEPVSQEQDVARDAFASISQETISASGATNPHDLEQLNRELQDRLDAVASERDALVNLLGDQALQPAATGNHPEALEQAKAAATRAQAAYQVEAARSRQFEQELLHLQHVRDELNQKLARDEAERTESKRRSEELEHRLSESAAEIERLKIALDQHLAERGSIEAGLRNQLQAAQAAAEKAESACQAERARSQRSTEEIESLRRARDELSARLAADHDAAEASRRRSEEREQQLRQSAAELERLATELERQVQERGSVASALSEQLKAAKEAAEKAESAYKDEVDRGILFQLEAARLSAAREEMNRKLAEHELAVVESRNRGEELEWRLSQSNAELERARTELERRATERGSVESQLREQLNAAREAAAKVKHEYREETSFLTKSADELAALRRVRDELNARLAAERELAASSRSRSAELEERLRDTKRELDRTKDELEKQRAARASLETRLDAAKDAVEAAKADYKHESALRAQLEREVSKLRRGKPINTPVQASAKPRPKAASSSSRKRIEKLVEDMLEQARVLQASLDRETPEDDSGVDEAA
jgi:CheY-like chemotaxis protein